MSAQRTATAAMDVMPPDWQVPSFTTTELSPKRNRYCMCALVLNEGERIRIQLEKMSPLSSVVDLVIVDGGSTDGAVTPDKLAKQNVRTLLTKTGPGRFSAQMRMAFAYGLMQGYDGIITVNGNNKDDTTGVTKFIEALDAGYDYIQGSRYMPGGHAFNTPLSRHIAIRVVHAPWISLAAGHRYTDTTNGFRGYSGRVLLDPRVAPFRDIFVRYELHDYLPVRAARLGYRITEVPVTRGYPATGKIPTKISFVRGNATIIKTLWQAYRHAWDPITDK